MYAGDLHRADLAWAKHAAAGLTLEQITAKLLNSRDLSKKGSRKRQLEYVTRTAEKALCPRSGACGNAIPSLAARGRHSGGSVKSGMPRVLTFAPFSRSHSPKMETGQLLAKHINHEV
jgi:hypothetical protein